MSSWKRSRRTLCGICRGWSARCPACCQPWPAAASQEGYRHTVLGGGGREGRTEGRTPPADALQPPGLLDRSQPQAPRARHLRPQPTGERKGHSNLARQAHSGVLNNHQAVVRHPLHPCRLVRCTHGRLSWSLLGGGRRRGPEIRTEVARGRRKQALVSFSHTDGAAIRRRANVAQRGIRASSAALAGPAITRQLTRPLQHNTMQTGTLTSSSGGDGGGCTPAGWRRGPQVAPRQTCQRTTGASVPR